MPLQGEKFPVKIRRRRRKKEEEGAGRRNRKTAEGLRQTSYSLTVSVSSPPPIPHPPTHLLWFFKVDKKSNVPLAINSSKTDSFRKSFLRVIWKMKPKTECSVEDNVTNLAAQASAFCYLLLLSSLYFSFLPRLYAFFSLHLLLRILLIIYILLLCRSSLDLACL